MDNSTHGQHKPTDVNAAGPAREAIYVDDDVSATIPIDGLADVVATVIADDELHPFSGPETEADVGHAERIAQLKQFVVAYNEYFCRQHLERHPHAAVCAVNPFQVFFPRIPGTSVPDEFLAWGLALIDNADEMIDQFASRGREVIAHVEAGNDILIVANHLTFLSIPAVITGLSELVRRDNPERYQEFLGRLHIIMNAASLTHEFYRRGTVSFANAFQTQPGIETDRVPGYAYTQRRLALHAVEVLTSTFRQPAGRILFACPSGTIDHWVVDSDGLSHIIMVEPTKATVGVFDQGLGHLAKMAITVNEHEYLAERASGDVVGGNIHVHLGPLHPPGDPGGQTASLMEELRTTVPNGRGGTVPAEIRHLDALPG